MLDRKHIVPEIHGKNKETEENKDDLESSFDACLSRLEDLRNQISSPQEAQSSLELQLETLFQSRGSKVLTDMERIAVILCRIAHKIIRSDSLSDTDYSVLLQIFELGLFLAQFKDRWLTHLNKTNALTANKWEAQKEFMHVGALLSPARELISLAQEYILRQRVLLGNRCDLCAYSLANISGIYMPSLSLLLQSRKMEFSLSGRGSEGLLPLDYFYFLMYNLSENGLEKNKILVEWTKKYQHEIDGGLFYLPNIDVQQYFRAEVRRIRDLAAAVAVVRAANSHALLVDADIVLQSHRRGKLSTRLFLDLLVETYTKGEWDFTVQILQEVSKYNAVASETITKSLIIIAEATELSLYFFKSSFIIDRDYAEACMLCIEHFHYISRDMLKLLCKSDYFGLLCVEKEVFQKITKTVAEMHCKEVVVKKGAETVTAIGWDVLEFCRRVFAVMNVSIGALEKGLILMLYFPSASAAIKRLVWDEVEAKGVHRVAEAVDKIIPALSICTGLDLKKPENAHFDPAKAPKPLLEEVESLIDVLNHYREIPAIQKQLLRMCKYTGIFPVLANYTPDVFAITCIQREIKRLRPNIKELHSFLMQIKERGELHSGSYWISQARRKISLGNTIRSLNSIMLQEDMLHTLCSEEDIVYLLRLVSKRPIPDTVLAAALVEKLEADSLSDSGLVMGSNSAISFTVPCKPLSVYLMMTQKEFTGRQSLLKVQGTNSEAELFIQDGVMLFRTRKPVKTSEEIVEEVEYKVSFPKEEGNAKVQSAGGGRVGWKISLGVHVNKYECQVYMGSSVVKIPHGVKPVSMVVGEEFRGILNRVLVLEEIYKSGRLCSKPNDLYYVETLVEIEKAFQYYNKFGLLIDSSVPYLVSGKSKVRMVNTFQSASSQWRASERLCRFISKLSAKHYQVEDALHSSLHPLENLHECLK
ncbi:uncharacterized protein NEMAJ01_1911 [Nematocida major]|uniref:uncharacterized protein n=1 Tax=Nematocida major TaxID=1912982 RepID=UPI0020073833|nr:uncharacterized protein NEMAJ01_1911 [Nematocida major]KAH9387015.1 hypothetical protein NEMAJ01_1911 [Nematocida major]